MSQLMLSELPLDDQIAIQLAHSARLIGQCHDFFSRLGLAAAGRGFTPCLPVGAARANPLEGHMLERQIARHPQIAPCPLGHAGRLYETHGTRPRYHVECSVCAIRTAKVPTIAAASRDWAAGNVQPIVVHA